MSTALNGLQLDRVSPRVAAVVLTVAVAIGLLVAVSAIGGPAPVPPDPAAAAPPAPPEPITLGVAADDTTGLDRFGVTTGTRAGIYSWYVGWAGSPDFDGDRADAAIAGGALPMLTWEPWTADGGVDQPEFALARIVAGDHDEYIARFAAQIRDWGGTLALRFAHELDAPHYPWSVGLNGNTAQDAVAAWHHVREVFAEQGADVVWIWCVNVHAQGGAPYDTLYPGDDTVDWIGLDGYNGGSVLPWGGWSTPGQVFGDSLGDLRELSDRPVVITEVGSAEEGGDKAGWIRDLFTFARDAHVRGLVWFDYEKEADWRIESSPGAAAAFREQVAVPDRLGPPPLPERFTR